MAEKAKESKCLVVVRVRGTVRASREVRETLRMLHLTRNNYAVLVNNDPSFVGMIKQAHNYVTYGEVLKETVEALVKERGRLQGGKKLTEEYVQKQNYGSLADLANAIFSGDIEYRKLPNIQPVFKLHPPTKGFKGKIKRSYVSGGELGYRGDQINELLKRML